MFQLVRSTTAYAAFSRDADGKRLSHAYLLRFDDEDNLRAALKLFALKFFGENEFTPDGRRILDESFTDLKILPQQDKKITVESVSKILEDSAMRPVERDKKLYIISGIDSASALVQNKLLKTLEEPLEGIYFLLGATSLSPVLDTVISRVKPLDIPPFSEGRIFEALERAEHKSINREAAAASGGIFGVAQSMASGDWFKEINAAAEEIFNATDINEAGAISLKYGDTKYKSQLLSCLNRRYFSALTGGENGAKWSAGALTFALEKLVKANADLKFNAYFQGLLFDFMLSVIKENDKWLKSQA